MSATWSPLVIFGFALFHVFGTMRFRFCGSERRVPWIRSSWPGLKLDLAGEPEFMLLLAYGASFAIRGSQGPGHACSLGEKKD